MAAPAETGGTTGQFEILGWYQAAYAFKAEVEAELDLNVGDIVAVYAMDSDWWEGEKADGSCGLFPGNHVVEWVEETDLNGTTGGEYAETSGGPMLPPYTSGATGGDHKATSSPVMAPQSSGAAGGGGGGKGKPTGGAGTVVAKKTQVAKPKPKTKFGLWASQMALLSGYFALFVGLADIVWGAKDDNRGLIYILCGLYCIVVGLGTLAYEYSVWGQARSGDKIPFRGMMYFMLCIFMFFAVPSVFGGAFYLAVAVVNFVAAYYGEEYDAPKSRKTDLSKDDLKPLATKSIDQRILEWIQVKRQQNQIGLLVFLFLYFAANFVVFFVALDTWIEKNDNFGPSEKLSGWAPWAKAFGNSCDLNCSIIVVPVLRTVIRFLYNISTGSESCTAKMLRFLLKFVPIDRALDFHKLIAKVILFVAMGHTVMHLFNYINAPTNTMDKFGVWPWVSGGIIFMCMLLIYGAAAPIVKAGQFEIFWYSHHSFIMFFFMLLLHGDGGFNPNFWKWFVGPGTLYIFERLMRIWRARQPVVLLSVTNMKPNVFAVEFAKDQGGILAEGYKDGQYMFLKCPTLSKIQWHPFTISSAPEEPTVTFHIRKQGKGSWTNDLHDYLSSFGRTHASRFELSRMAHGHQVPGKIVGPDGNQIIELDGPHSAPTQHVTEYHTVMVIGGGIGVTPVAATLKSVLLHRWNYSMGLSFPDNAYFFWVCSHRDLQSFRWFVHSIKDCEDEMYDKRSKNAKDMYQKRFEFHMFISSVPKGTVPEIKTIPAEDDDYSFWGRRPKTEEEAKRNIDLDKLEAPFTALELLSFMECPDARLWTDPKYQHLIPRQGVYIPDDNSYILLGQDIYIWNGRPRWKDRFEAVVRAHPKGDIGLTFCGNPYIAADLEQMCYKYSSVQDERIIRMHKENF